MAKKYYAVRRGRVPGIYMTWEDCKRMVDDYPGAVFKSFPTAEEAAAFLEEGANVRISGRKEGVSQKPSGAEPKGGSGGSEDALPDAYAFVDGSYNTAANTYGYGGFLVYGGNRVILQGSGDDPEMASMRNVAGEILGSRAAIGRAVELGLPELTIYYDYMGIEMWATGQWKRNKAGTIAYYEYVQSVKDKIRLSFVKVKGHSGVEGNEEADWLAKEAAGITG